MRCLNPLRMCMCFAALIAPSTQAALTLPFGDSFLNGTLDFFYANDGSARIDPIVYVDSNENFQPGDLAEVYFPPGDVEGATGLEFSYSVAGLGTSTLEVAYSISNHTGLTWTGLRFLADVSGDTLDTLLERARTQAGALSDADAVNWGIDDFFAGDLFVSDILNTAQLDDADGCGDTPCEAEGALQWNLAALKNGETWTIEILLSEDETRNANRWIEFELFDGAAPLGQTLTFSGQATVVPVPAGAVLLCGALPLLLSRRRRANAIA